MARFLGINLGSQYPSTQNVEEHQDKLQKEYKKFHSFSENEKYIRYGELDKIVHSGEFEKLVVKLKTERFKDTDAFKKYERYKYLSKLPDIKKYNSFIKSGKADKIDKISTSNELIKYQELKNKVDSPEFIEAQKEKGFKKSDAYKIFKEFRSLEKSKNLKFYFKTIKSSIFSVYNKTSSSKELIELNELEIYINSSEFIDLKKELNDKNRFKNSEQNALLQEFEALTKDHEIIWYLKIKHDYPFKDIEKWSLSFEDDFDSTQIDESKWLTGYFWGKALLGKTYVLDNETQFFTNKNIELRDSTVKLIARKEECSGLSWNPSIGFTPKQFAYTSGMLCSGQSFRQKYGKFEAKIKFSQTEGSTNAFWMVSETMSPQINILKTDNAKEISNGVIYSTGVNNQSKTASIKAKNLGKQFHIYTLEWTPEYLKWKINGVEIQKQTNNIPSNEMYIILSHHLNENIKESSLPATMEIEWIKCYKLI